MAFTEYRLRKMKWRVRTWGVSSHVVHDIEKDLNGIVQKNKRQNNAK